MPFNMVRNDIARVHADAVVNAANTHLAEGGGVCGALFAAAGRDQMHAACEAIGFCPTGEAVVTPAFGLHAQWCIHAVGPIWRDGTHGEEAALRSCYHAMFARVAELGARSVAYPLISAGIYGYPVDQALAVAREETRAFLDGHEDVSVTLVVYDASAVRLGKALGEELRAYIDDAYVERGLSGRRRGMELDRERSWEDALFERDARPMPAGAMADAVAAPAADFVPAPAAAAAPRTDAAQREVIDYLAVPTGDLEDALDNLDAGFSETLLALIDQRGLTDAEVYHRANLSRQLFSKIRNNPAYRPTKPTAVALAMALELDLGATQDLLSRAGLTLSRTSKFDVIVRFFIERRIFDTYRLNEALFTYDQPLVGSF